MEEEINMMKSFSLLKAWLTVSKEDNWSLEDCRRNLQECNFFRAPTFTMGWGDSFLLDQMFFRFGGSYMFQNHPELTSPKVGDEVVINDIPHVIQGLGLLTFDASPR